VGSFIDEKRLVELEKAMEGLTREVSVRFSNGQKSFEGISNRLSTVEMDIKPKAPDWVKILGVGFALVSFLVGAQLWMTDRFAERPTRYELDKKLAPIIEMTDRSAKEIRSIAQDQTEHRVLLRGLREDTQEILEHHRATSKRRGR
jgi:hypothetical protein